MIKNFLKCLLVTSLLSIVFYSTNCEAATADNLSDGKFNLLSKKERADIAKDLLEKINSLNVYLPNLKPSELAWIEKEDEALEKLNNTDPEAWLARDKKLYNSPEFQHQNLKSLLLGLQNNLNCIINEKTALKEEMLCWALVSYNIPSKGTFHDSLMILKRNGRIPEDIGKKTNLYIRDNYIVAFDWYSRGIQKYFILPYLRGDIK